MRSGLFLLALVHEDDNIRGVIALKQLEVTEKKIGENTFYIKPFGAFGAANLSGELGGTIVPIFGAIFRARPAGTEVMNMEISTALPTLMEAMSGLSGDKVETLLKELLIKRGNISVEGPDTDGRTVKLDEDLANEIFCCEVEKMYQLAFEVIKLNYGSFFENLGVLFGDRLEAGAGTSN